MLEKKLPAGGSSFRMSGPSGFVRKFYSLTNRGQYVEDNMLILKIIEKK
jgi:hypothetical protein